jgi:hypothetical protein
MGKPTATELRQALDRAIQMRESGNDPDFVAKSLLNLHYRLLKAEKAVEAARRYLHAGQSPTDHRQLMLAVQEAENAGHDRDSDDLPIIGRGPAEGPRE